MEGWREVSGIASSNEEREATIKALLQERKGYEIRGLDERVAEVDRVLQRLGHEAAAPAKRAESRPASSRRTSR